MIKIEKGDFEVNGTHVEVLGELSVIIKSLHEDVFMGKCGMTAEESKDDIMFAVNQGFKTDDEMRVQVVEALGMLSDMLADLKDKLDGKDDK